MYPSDLRSSNSDAGDIFGMLSLSTFILLISRDPFCLLPNVLRLAASCFPRSHRLKFWRGVLDPLDLTKLSYDHESGNKKGLISIRIAELASGKDSEQGI